MEVLLVIVNGLVAWTSSHWFLTFLLLFSFKGIHLHFGDLKKDKKENTN